MTIINNLGGGGDYVPDGAITNITHTGGGATNFVVPAGFRAKVNGAIQPGTPALGSGEAGNVFIGGVSVIHASQFKGASGSGAGGQGNGTGGWAEEGVTISISASAGGTASVNIALYTK